MLCYLCHISEQRKTMKAKMNHTAVLISKTLLVTVKTYKIPAPGLICLGSLDEMDTAQKMASTISIHVNLKHKQMCLFSKSIAAPSQTYLHVFTMYLHLIVKSCFITSKKKCGEWTKQLLFADIGIFILIFHFWQYRCRENARKLPLIVFKGTEQTYFLSFP